MSSKVTLITVILGMTLCFVLGTGASLWAYQQSDTDLLEHQKKILSSIGTGGIALAISSVIGGGLGLLFKVFMANYQHDQVIQQTKTAKKKADQDADQAFFKAILADIKTVFDTVERARLLIDAHKSAKTYGEQMRELPGAVVILHNVKRALRPGYAELEEELAAPIACCNAFMKNLMGEFQREYITLSILQGEYEARKEAYLDVLRGKAKDSPTKTRRYPDEIWSRIEGMDHLTVLRAEGDIYFQYDARFVVHIDAASYAVRKKLHGGDREEQDKTAQRRALVSRLFFQACQRNPFLNGATIAKGLSDLDPRTRLKLIAKAKPAPTRKDTRKK